MAMIWAGIDAADARRALLTLTPEPPNSAKPGGLGYLKSRWFGSSAIQRSLSQSSHKTSPSRTPYGHCGAAVNLGVTYQSVATGVRAFDALAARTIAVRGLEPRPAVLNRKPSHAHLAKSFSADLINSVDR